MKTVAANAMIACEQLVRIYRVGAIDIQALQGLELLVTEGELAAIVGPSGSGKSTLMNILAGLDVPTAGSVRVAGRDLAALSVRERIAYRASIVGFVWQQTSRNLLPYRTVAQNVTMPMRSRRDRARRVRDLLELLGVAHAARWRPERMSGGEQQRTAIAVALANQPRVLLADEPTGELDSTTAAEVFAALRTVHAELGVTVLIVTHDAAISAHVPRTIAIRDGRVSAETWREITSAQVAEYTVLDRTGRLQLPRHMTEPLGIADLVRLQGEPDHISIWPQTPSAGKDLEQ
jgi:ABC-type lipoprotein export system ATPase subunit